MKYKLRGLSLKTKQNERFLTLRSIVPSITKDDKVSILDDAIEYLRKLEKRIRELEARREIVDIESRTKRSPQDMVERTSDNYFNKIDNSKKPVIKKRKVSDINAARVEINSDAHKGSSSDDVTVIVNGNEVMIEMKCPTRERRVLEIIEAVSCLV
ncbi:hypothetical protein RIF29_29872 [Crotalaria pallida]|uniref:BHLH domain-containing protein n=1 Tax=Crotalaria pallida TaxID=3830 RepID=A0AAN9EHN3_CROPI